MKPFIGIKKIWYGDVISEAVTKASLKTLLGSMTEVKNSHQDTWQYTEDDPTYTDYINELNGEIYYRDVTQKGAKTITFTMGEWTFDDKVALQGGERWILMQVGLLPILPVLSIKALWLKQKQVIILSLLMLLLSLRGPKQKRISG